MAVALDPGIFKAYDVRGIYGKQFDGDLAELIGRAFARVLGNLSGKPVQSLTIGLGRDMRLTAPELAARYREGILAEGADVLDAGQVGTEMLYWLVGSHGLDGGLMCTASHNPKAYTGAKLVREGALALSGETGIQDMRAEIEAGMPEPTGRARQRPGDRHLRRVSAGRAALHRPRFDQAAEGRARRRQRDGGADGRAAAGAPATGADRDLLDPGRQLPRPRAEPAAAREPHVHHREGARERR